MSDGARWSRRLFRILLLAYPLRVRDEHGDDMWHTFERHHRYMAAMMVVCLFACIVPTRRALRVEPTEALREGG